MQIVAHAQERETLFEELAHPARAEQKDPQDHLVFARLADQRVGGGQQFRRRVHVRKFIFHVEAHRHAKVVLAQKEHVDAGHGRNLGHVVDAALGLHLQRDNHIVVGTARVAQQTALIHGTLREIDAARTAHRITRAAHRLARLLRRVDVRHQHAIGTQVERLLNSGPVAVAGHAHHALGSAHRNRAKHGRQLLVAHRAMLHIHQKPIVATMGQLLGDGGAMGVQEQPHLGLPFPHLLLELRSRYGIGHMTWSPQKIWPPYRGPLGLYPNQGSGVKSYFFSSARIIPPSVTSQPVSPSKAILTRLATAR